MTLSEIVTDSKCEHLSNAESEITTTPSVMTQDVSVFAGAYRMSFVPSFVKRMLSTDLKCLFFLSTVIVDKCGQFANAIFPISLTFLGMLIDVSLEQP